MKTSICMVVMKLTEKVSRSIGAAARGRMANKDVGQAAGNSWQSLATTQPSPKACVVLRSIGMLTDSVPGSKLRRRI